MFVQIWWKNDRRIVWFYREGLSVLMCYLD
jgi:hypothetical protein